MIKRYHIALKKRWAENRYVYLQMAKESETASCLGGTHDRINEAGAALLFRKGFWLGDFIPAFDLH